MGMKNKLIAPVLAAGLSLGGGCSSPEEYLSVDEAVRVVTRSGFSDVEYVGNTGDWVDTADPYSGLQPSKLDGNYHLVKDFGTGVIAATCGDAALALTVTPTTSGHLTKESAHRPVSALAIDSSRGLYCDGDTVFNE